MLQNSNCHQNHKTKVGVKLYSNEILGLIDSFAGKYGRKGIADGRTDKTLIKGVPAAPGVAVGPAVVIQTPEDLQRVSPDSIIVCSWISPLYSIAFSMIRGIISERGGVMSIPATIAREYGLPVATGVKSAERVISNGDLIRIDGTNGCVQIILKAQQYTV